MKSTQAMRDRIRELATPERDDFDRAVLAVVDDLEAIKLSLGQTECQELKRYLPDLVKNAMLVAWREICTDTGCHPLDVEHGKGKYLTFEPRHWAQMAGDIVASQVERFWTDQLSYADLRASGGIAEADSIQLGENELGG